MSFSLWNDVLFKHFFNPEMAGQRVRIYVTSEIINKLGNHDELGNCKDFLNHVEDGPDGAGGRTLCDKAKFLRARAARMSREQQRSYLPDFLPYLCLFILAARHGIGEETNELAYYDRLHNLRGEPPDRVGSGEMKELFGFAKLLDEWSHKWQAGKFGFFTASERRGAHRYTSFWRSQTLLSPDQRGRLPELFCNLGLDPADGPGLEEMEHLVQQSRRAAELLGGTNRLQNRDLIDEIQSEFAHWDGLANITVNGESPQSTRSVDFRLAFSPKKKPQLRIFIEVDGAELPESVEFRGDAQSYICRRIDTSLFGPLQANDGTVLDAAELFERELQFDGTLLKGGKNIRLHAKWKRRITYYMQWDPSIGWFQRRTLDVPGDILVLSSALAANEPILNWAEANNIHPDVFSCDGLPENWTLIRIKAESIPDQAISAFPSAARRNEISIRLVGGVRTADRANEYFDFGLPTIRVEGNLSLIKVAAEKMGGGNIELIPDTALSTTTEVTAPGREYTISPDTIAGGACIRITLRQNDHNVEGEIIADQTLYVAGHKHHTPPESLAEYPIIFTLSGEQSPPLTDRSDAGVYMHGSALTRKADEVPLSEIAPGAPDLETEEYNEESWRLLRVLSSRSELPLRAVKELSHKLLQKHLSTVELDGWRDVIWTQIKALRWLGHCEIIEENGRWDRVVASPQCLALLPGVFLDHNLGWRCFRAVLCGRQSQGDLQKWREDVRKLNLETLIHSQQPYFPLVPQRVIFQGRDLDSLKQLAVIINPKLSLQYTAQFLLSQLPSVKDRLNRLAWEQGRPPASGWDRRFFDAQGLCSVAQPPSQLFMAELCNQTDGGWYHCLSDGDRRARVSREMGRWIVSSCVNRPALRTADRTLLLPVELEPDGLWGKAFALCSGFAPKVVQYQVGQSPFANGGAYPPPPPVPLDSVYARRRGLYSGHFYTFERAAQWVDPSRAGFFGWQDVRRVPITELKA